jgi:hypothetical protein
MKHKHNIKTYVINSSDIVLLWRLWKVVRKFRQYSAEGKFDGAWQCRSAARVLFNSLMEKK